MKTRSEAAADTQVVVREIPTKGQGTWYAAINTGMTDKKNVVIKLPGTGQILDATNKKPVGAGEQITASFYPFEMKAWWRP